MIWIELLILLACIVIGARLGGIALGALAGVGLLVFVFLFGLPPGGPPQSVLGMIIAVITALATMQAAGGLDYLVSLAEKVMRKRPQYITFVAPVVTYLLVLASGTAHVIYALLPVIAEVSRNGKVRPERPLSISVIAGFQGVIASPISAATVAMLGFLLAQGNLAAEAPGRNYPLNVFGCGDRSIVRRLARKRFGDRSRLSETARDRRSKSAAAGDRNGATESVSRSWFDVVFPAGHRARGADRDLSEPAAGVRSCQRGCCH